MEPNLALSDLILGFQNPQELQKWINGDNSATELFNWHRAVRASHDSITLAHNQLVEEMIEQQTRMNELVTERDELIASGEQKVIEHQGVIANYQDQLRDLTSRTMNNTSSNHPRLSSMLPDPPRFTGDKGPNIDHWMSLMKDKLFVNHDHYPTDAVQLAYVKTRISGDAANRMSPHTRVGANWPFNTADEFIHALFTLYGGPFD